MWCQTSTLDGYIPYCGKLSEEQEHQSVIAAKSDEADLVLLGFRDETLKRMKKNLFAGYEEIGNVLFVNAAEEVKIR